MVEKKNSSLYRDEIIFFYMIYLKENYFLTILPFVSIAQNIVDKTTSI